MVPDAAHISFVGQWVPLALLVVHGGILSSEKGKLLSVAGAKNDDVRLDHLILHALVLGPVRLAEDNGAVRRDVLRPRREVNVAAPGIGDWHLNESTTDALDDAAVESVAIRRADVSSRLVGLDKEHCFCQCRSKDGRGRKHTLADMIKLGIGLANKLVITAGCACGQPQDEADITVVKGPHHSRVAQDRMHVGRIEEAGACVVEGNRQPLGWLAAENRQDSRIQVTLYTLA